MVRVGPWPSLRGLCGVSLTNTRHNSRVQTAAHITGSHESAHCNLSKGGHRSHEMRRFMGLIRAFLSRVLESLKILKHSRLVFLVCLCWGLGGLLVAAITLAHIQRPAHGALAPRLPKPTTDRLHYAPRNPHPVALPQGPVPLVDPFPVHVVSRCSPCLRIRRSYLAIRRLV